MKLGIMTGGGDCPGLNALVRAAVKKGVTELGCEFVGLVDGFRSLCEDGFARPVEPTSEASSRAVGRSWGRRTGTTRFATPCAMATGGRRRIDRARRSIGTGVWSSTG
jgi:6-phosphofructokinase 1